MVGLVLAEMSVFVLGAALKTQLVQPGVDGLRRLLLTVVARLLGMMTALVVVTFVLKGIDDRAVAIAIVGGIGAVVLTIGLFCVLLTPRARAMTKLALLAAAVTVGDRTGYELYVAPIVCWLNGTKRVQLLVWSAGFIGRGWVLGPGEHADISAYVPVQGAPFDVVRLLGIRIGDLAYRRGRHNDSVPDGELCDAFGWRVGTIVKHEVPWTVTSSFEQLGDRAALVHPLLARELEESTRVRVYRLRSESPLARFVLRVVVYINTAARRKYGDKWGDIRTRIVDQLTTKPDDPDREVYEEMLARLERVSS